MEKALPYNQHCPFGGDKDGRILKFGFDDISTAPSHTFQNLPCTVGWNLLYALLVHKNDPSGRFQRGIAVQFEPEFQAVHETSCTTRTPRKLGNVPPVTSVEKVMASENSIIAAMASR